MPTVIPTPKAAAPRTDRATKKVRTRERIVQEASRLVRTQGLEKPAIDDMMAAADLTRGGFYAHFTSRDALVAEALDRAFDEARKYFFFYDEWANAPKAEDLHGKKWIDYATRQYLSDGHLHEEVARCPLPSIASEVSRSPAPVRRVFTENIRKIFDAAIHRSGAKTKQEKERTLAMFASWVGAMTIARALDDEKLAKDLVDACRSETLREWNVSGGGGAKKRARKPKKKA